MIAVQALQARPASSVVTHPTFFLVGASRCGTTSLWQYLRQHPDIHMPSSIVGKEPSFFCDLTPPWAEDYRTYDRYLSLFEKGARSAAVGDASTSYLASPESAGRIAEKYPDARIVIILRNPVDRAFSLYRFLCFWGMESAPTFEKALAREPRRLDNEAFKRETQLLYYCFLYYNSGLFSAQIERYFAMFPRDRIRIVLYDDLKKDGLRVAQDLYRFLSVNPGFEPEVGVHNQSEFPASVRLQRLLCGMWNGSPLCPRQPIRRRDQLHLPVAIGMNLLLGKYRRTKMRPETRRMLTDRFRADVQKTGALIGRNLDAWTQDRKGR